MSIKPDGVVDVSLLERVRAPEKRPRHGVPNGVSNRHIRARTISARVMRLLNRTDKETKDDHVYVRPKTRADCSVLGHSQERPCPWVGCKYHLYLDVNPETGSIKINFPDLEPWEMKDTCSLDVAERGGVTLEEVGDVMQITRERVRQIEVRSLLTIKMTLPDHEELAHNNGYTWPA